MQHKQTKRTRTPKGYKSITLSIPEQLHKRIRRTMLDRDLTWNLYAELAFAQCLEDEPSRTAQLARIRDLQNAAQEALQEPPRLGEAPREPGTYFPVTKEPVDPFLADAGVLPPGEVQS